MGTSSGDRTPELPRETEHYVDQGDGAVQCQVCPRTCKIPKGGRGVCQVRENRDGKLYLRTYGQVVATHVDPIEKKPLFHVAPGAKVLSVAAKGCNLQCDFCQNYPIAIEHDDAPELEMPPVELVDRATATDIDGIAYTYTEPTIFLEYALDTMRKCPDDTLQVLVSNGYMRPETVETLTPHLDAINIDIKGDTTFYREHGGIPDPAPIFKTAEQFADRDVHLEVTNLLIPGENDVEETIRERMEWLRDEVGRNVPVHFSRFHPAYQLQDVPPTPVETLERAMQIARESGLNYVYCGNVPGHGSESTYCPGCGSLLIRREGYAITELHLSDRSCPQCGEAVPILGSAQGLSVDRRRGR